MSNTPAPEHSPCCSSHGLNMSCERYRRTHFVEVGPCCAAYAAEPQGDAAAASAPAAPTAPAVEPTPAPEPAPPVEISLHVHDDIEQGTEEWHAIRRGIITASVVGLLVTTKTLKPANNDTQRGLAASLTAERITGHTEPSPTSRDMERGKLDEPYARDYYSEHYAPAREVGFMVRDDFGFKIGYSPDGLVGDDGLIEIKSRAQKKHLQTILADAVPAENMAQIQCGLLVSGREWCDYVSFCSSMKLWVKRVYPDPNWYAAIIAAVEKFEETALEMIDTYEARTANMPATERLDHFLDDEMEF